MKTKSLYLIVALAMPTVLFPVARYEHFEDSTEQSHSPSAEELDTALSSNHDAACNTTIELVQLAEEPSIHSIQPAILLDSDHPRRHHFHKQCCYKKMRHLICPGITAIIMVLIAMYDPRTHPASIAHLEEIIEEMCLKNDACAALSVEQQTLVTKTIADEYLAHYSMPLQGCLSDIKADHYLGGIEAMLYQKHLMPDYTEEKLRIAGQRRRKPLYKNNTGHTAQHAKRNVPKYY